MNFISTQQAVCMFPQATFINGRTYVCNMIRNEDVNRAWMEKYEQEGFKIVEYIHRPIPTDLCLGVRHIADSQSWVINTAGEFPYKEKTEYGNSKRKKKTQTSMTTVHLSMKPRINMFITSLLFHPLFSELDCKQIHAGGIAISRTSVINGHTDIYHNETRHYCTAFRF